MKSNKGKKINKRNKKKPFSPRYNKYKQFEWDKRLNETNMYTWYGIQQIFYVPQLKTLIGYKFSLKKTEFFHDKDNSIKKQKNKTTKQKSINEWSIIHLSFPLFERYKTKEQLYNNEKPLFVNISVKFTPL